MKRSKTLKEFVWSNAACFLGIIYFDIFTVSLTSTLDRGGGYSHTLPIRVCATQRGRDFEAPDLERGIHFRGVF